MVFGNLALADIETAHCNLASGDTDAIYGWRVYWNGSSWTPSAYPFGVCVWNGSAWASRCTDADQPDHPTDFVTIDGNSDGNEIYTPDTYETCGSYRIYNFNLPWSGYVHLFGYGGNDDLSGTEGDDFIYGGADGDVLEGFGGDDDIYGEGGTDSVRGGDGADRLVGGNGNCTDLTDNRDLIEGGDGDDVIHGCQGADEIYGEEQHPLYLIVHCDTLTGSTGNDYIYGETGNDEIAGCAGDDFIFGGSGSDHIAGGGEAGDEVDGESQVDICTCEDPGTYVNCETGSGC
jgi:Ca2+-binding RTX toxin-like protein